MYSFSPKRSDSHDRIVLFGPAHKPIIDEEVEKKVVQWSKKTFSCIAANASAHTNTTLPAPEPSANSIVPANSADLTHAVS